MRQLRPGAGEAGLLNLLLPYVLAIVYFVASIRAAHSSRDAESGIKSLAIESPKALATLSPQAGKVPKGVGAGKATSGGVIQQHRNLRDFEVEDFVLLATVDGRLSAIERKDGRLRWELVTQEPAVRTIYHRANSSAIKGTKKEDYDPDDLVEWIVGPTEDGQLFFFTPEHGCRLEKLDVTVKDIIHNTPYRPPGVDKVYNGAKKTTTYAVNSRTGIIEKVFPAPEPQVMVNDKKCKSTHTEFDGECEPDEVESEDKLIMVARIEYTITIQSWKTGEMLWTIIFNEWSPNNSDMDLRAQHNRPIDGKYIYSRHDGRVIGFNEPEDASGERAPLYTTKMQSPVIRVFDVVSETDADGNELLVLPQPPIQLREGNSDQTFVGSTPDGEWYAMSEEKFPFVTDQASYANCYNRPSDWARLPQKERQKSLIGIHKVHHHADVNGGYYRSSPLGLPGPGHEVNIGGSNPRDHMNSPPVSLPSPPVAVNGYLGAVELRTVLAGIATILLVFVVSPKTGFWSHIKVFPSKDTAETMSKLVEKLDAISPPITATVPPEPALPEPSGPSQESVQDVKADLAPLLETEKTEKPKANGVGLKPIVRFEEPPKEDKVDGEAPAKTPGTPEKKKHPRGRRGPGRKKKAQAAEKAEKLAEKILEEGEQIPTPAQTPQKVMQRGKQVTVVSSGQVEESAPGSPFILTQLEVFEEEVIGAGSQGTTVHKGKFEGKLVAVKRILTTYADVALKEVRTLQESDYHENVVRYYCQQAQGSFLYIALELCPGSLYDVITKPHAFPELVQHMDPRDTLFQITHGLHHLHSLKIVHRDIKPQNILVGEPNGKSKRPRLLISDFGLCKKLQSDEYSFGATTAQHAGTVGWRAPELLVDAKIPTVSTGHSGSGVPSESSGSSTTDVVVDPLTKRRATRAIDIFALGCVCFFVLSGGHHPFGERYSRELNIMKGESDLSSLTIHEGEGHEAIELISSMIQRDPKQRPDTGAIGAHPFFWPVEKRLEFVIAVSDRFELEKDKEKNKPSYISSHIPVLEEHAVDLWRPHRTWPPKLDKHLYADVFGPKKRRGYDEERLLHLLRVIRNKKNHFLDLDDATKQVVGDPPERFYQYFASRYDGLLMYTYHVMVETGLAKESGFRRFFECPWLA